MAIPTLWLSTHLSRLAKSCRLRLRSSHVTNCMAKKKTDYKTNTPVELNKIVAEKREELRALRFNVAGSKNRDVKMASKLRKEIGRALTALNAPVAAAK